MTPKTRLCICIATFAIFITAFFTMAIMNENSPRQYLQILITIFGVISFVSIPILICAIYTMRVGQTIEFDQQHMYYIPSNYVSNVVHDV